MKPLHAFSLLGVALLLSACGGDGEPTQAHGPDPKLPEPQRGLLPSMKIAQPAAWGELKPTVPEGFSVTAIATNLKIPRQSLVLPNGDILVAEGRGGQRGQAQAQGCDRQPDQGQGQYPGQGWQPSDLAARC